MEMRREGRGIRAKIRAGVNACYFALSNKIINVLAGGDKNGTNLF